MAFCTQCGADVKGAFCNQCGTRAQAAAAPPAGAPAPVKRGRHPLVWLGVAVLGLFVLAAVGVLGLGAFFVHKVQQDGADLTLARVIAAVNPNLEVVRTNNADGTVTLRDRTNNKEFSIGIDAARSGKFTLQAKEDGKAAIVEFGGEVKLPSWMPSYPGSRPQAVFSAKGESDRESGEAGNFYFNTPDPPSRVLEFYEKKARELELPIRSGTRGTMSAGDDEHGRFMKVVVVERSELTRVNVTYGRKL